MMMAMSVSSSLSIGTEQQAPQQQQHEARASGGASSSSRSKHIETRSNEPPPFVINSNSHPAYAPVKLNIKTAVSLKNWSRIREI